MDKITIAHGVMRWSQIQNSGSISVFEVLAETIISERWLEFIVFSFPDMFLLPMHFLNNK